MERLVTISTATAFAIVGFFVGLFGAAQFGLHESLHVFIPAIITSLLAAVLVMALLPSRYSRLTITGRRVFALLSGALLIGCLAFFWRIIT